MRWHLWATAVAAYAAELRLETFVTVELTLDNLPLSLRAHVEDDPEKAAERFCKDAIPLSLECKERFAAALRAERDAVRIRTGRVKPVKPPSSASAGSRRSSASWRGGDRALPATRAMCCVIVLLCGPVFLRVAHAWRTPWS